MIGKQNSFFVAGILVGALISTLGFSLLIRQGPNSQAAGNAEIVLKLAHSLDQQHPVHEAMEYLAERLREKSDGRVGVQIFPNGQLGGETECVEQVQRGALDMTKTSTAALESFIPEFAVFGTPYLFRDREHALAVYEGEIGKELLKAGTDVGLFGLCFYDAGARSFYTRDTPILTPDDLSGLKIRVQESQTAMQMVEALGGSPTPMNFGELYSGLQTKVVDGAENNPPSFYSNRHFEVCKHYSLDEHARVPDILLMSQSSWQNLPPEVQGWLQEAADESAEFQRQRWREKTAEVLEEVKKQGVTVHLPDKTTFATRVSAMVEQLRGTPIGELVQRIQDLK